MLDLDEQALIEESKKHCEVFLQKEQRSLATFTRDPSLMYIPDPKLERFLLDPSKGVLYLPLQSFLDGKLDDNQIKSCGISTMSYHYTLIGKNKLKNI